MVPLNQDDLCCSKPIQKITTASKSDFEGTFRRTSTYIAKACHHALFHYTVYSHYTATIQPEEVMSEAWGLYVGAPAERSGEIDK